MTRVPWPPIEPPPPRVRFPDPSRARAPEVLAVGCDFSPSTLLLAYRSGIFPWPHADATPVGGSRGSAEGGTRDATDQSTGEARPEPLVLWFSPNPRAIFPLDDEPHWSRSLRRTLRKHPYRVTLDEDFEGTMRLCGETRANHTWIIPELAAGYARLHEMGWAHSVEVWDAGTGEQVGGIYGLALGGLFAGESMFHTKTDCSKIAFASLVDRLRARGFVLFDVQVQNPHLESLGCVEIPRRTYLARLAEALEKDCRIS